MSDELIGRNANQVPRNMDLGTSAFIDYKPSISARADYGYLTMPSTAGTTATYDIRLNEVIHKQNYSGMILFEYTICTFLYVVNPNDHYSYFTGKCLTTRESYDAVGTWRFHKLDEWTDYSGDYPYNSITGFSFVSDGTIGDRGLNALRVTFNSPRAGNTHGQSIRAIAAINILAASDGVSLVSGV